MATTFLGQMTTIFYSISHSSMAIIILLYLFQIIVLSLKKISYILVVAVHVGRCYIPDRSQHCVFQVIPDYTSSWYLYFNKYFSLENTSSTGFRSGEYTWRKTSSIPKSFRKLLRTLSASP